MRSSGVSAGSHAERLLSILSDHSDTASQRPRLLVIDPESATVAGLDTHLAVSEAEILAASTVMGARELLAAAPVSLIVCDPGIAAGDQHTFFTRLGEHAAANGIALVALIGKSTSLSEVDLYALGADAVLRKPLDQSALVALARTRLRRIVQERSRMLQDAVTGLPNHVVFRDAYRRAAHLAYREREALSLAVLHVDSLRETRAEIGPTVADQLLRQIAAAVRTTLRKSDLLARWSGDALLMLLPNTDENGAQSALEKVYYRLQRLRPEGAEQAPPIALSAGVLAVQVETQLEEALEEMLKRLRPLVSVEEQALHEAHAPAPTTDRPRIMLAEDDALTASIVRHRLERAGYEVLHVSDGSKVLSMAPDAKVAMLILDVKMPFMDGFEALRRIRSIRSLRNVPVILLTSMGNEDDILHGFELGADDYIVKPFSPVELVARVRRRLQERRLPTAALAGEEAR